MKKHLLTALCLAVVVMLPACWGCCPDKKAENKEVTTEVAVAEAQVVELSTEAQAVAVPAEEVKS